MCILQLIAAGSSRTANEYTNVIGGGERLWKKVQADIRRQRKKFEAAEKKRAEWNARLKRLDEDGNPLGPERSKRGGGGWHDRGTAAASSTTAGGGGGGDVAGDGDGKSAAGAETGGGEGDGQAPPASESPEDVEKRKMFEARAAAARARASAEEAKAAPPGEEALLSYHQNPTQK